ncbi:unnamed protein product [Zymoseptoria tritici ST99CH_3D1]|nr:unnamed protein product [Zymoseptoria tritici ST99CH_3D1]
MGAAHPKYTEIHEHDEQPKITWKSYVWDSLDKSPEERKLVFKLDAFILTYASIGYFIKLLDQTAPVNAFVSGMKEDVGLYQNEFNYMQSLWAIGYVIGHVPSNMLLTRIRPSLWLPILEVSWSVLTLCTARCRTASQLYWIRFFVGLLESGFYPGLQFIIGTWYRKDELAKRSSIFQCFAPLATIFSAFLMSGVYKLDGVGGYRGWQWLFIVDGLLSLPVALVGFVMLPDTPETTRAWFLSPEERVFARKRMQLEGRKGRQPYSLAKFKTIFGSWRVYVLPLLFILYTNGTNGRAGAFVLWLKSSTEPKYEVWQVNIYSTIAGAVEVAATLIFAWTSDTVFRGRRWPGIVFAGGSNIIIYISLAIWEIPLKWKWACHSLAGIGYGLAGLLYAWAHELCSDDFEERALITGAMNGMGWAVGAWLPLIVWQQVEAPQFRKGYITATLLSAAMIVMALVVKKLHERQNQKNAPVEEYLLDGGSPRASEDSVVASGAETLHRED